MKLRNAVKEDMIFLFDLRNDISVRKSAFNARKIDLDTHKKWFNRKLIEGNSIILIGEEKGVKVGQVRFDVERKMISAELDVSSQRGKGYGGMLLRRGCRYTFKKLRIRKIVAHIKEKNDTSIKTFIKAEFMNCGHVYYKDQKCVEMILKNI
jgi:RimJ/RimL family protein N-acetyltransferase